MKREGLILNDLQNRIYLSGGEAGELANPKSHFLGVIDIAKYFRHITFPYSS
jgi:hypothetical protein